MNVYIMKNKRVQENMQKSGVLTISLKALAANYRHFQDKVGETCAVAGVVKADAYGLGLKPIVEALTVLNCPQYFVATLDEAIQLRHVNAKAPVAVLGGLFHGAEEEYLAHNITPVLNSPDDIARWKNLVHQKEQSLPALLHIDTGMNRLGLSADETSALLQDKTQIEGIEIKTIMTHFACADDKDHPLTKKQAHDFANIAQHFPSAQKSLANSPGLFRSDAYHHDMVRPGYSLYGGNPTPELDNPMQGVVSLNARILQTRQCKKGESIGYGASHIFDQDRVTATIGMGYADGFQRSANAQKHVYYQGQSCPIIGRVSMDLVTVDLTHLEQKPKAGDMLEILGPHQTIDDLANAIGTIGYEILTSLGRRYARTYI